MSANVHLKANKGVVISVIAASGTKITNNTEGTTHMDSIVKVFRLLQYLKQLLQRSLPHQSTKFTGSSITYL